MNALIRLARPHQWVKNGVLILPAVFGGAALETSRLGHVGLGFIAFCLLSSCVYVVNDIVDREKDRLHPSKSNRPLASGAITVQSAGMFSGLLLIAGLAIAWLVGQSFFITAGFFLIVNALYTFWLKELAILDVMALAFSFVLRAYAGAMAVELPASTWLLLNTLLLSLFLALGKRRHELVLLEGNATSHRGSLSGYTPYLLDQLIGVTTASVVVIYMLYTISPEVATKLGTDKLYFTIPYVVYGIFRYLALIHKEHKGGSPTGVLIGDLPIMITVILWLLTAGFLLYAKI